jgi:hypothetical protein
MTDAERAAKEFAAKQRAFGLTHGDMEKIREEQIHGTTRMIPANNATNIPDEVFAEAYTGYQIPWHEEMHYHIALEARLWDATGAKPQRLSQHHIQVYTKEAYDQQINMKPTNGFHGYVTHILHNPELVAVKRKEAPVTNDEYAHLTTAKDAKAEYKRLSGNEPVRTWTRDRAIEEIKKLKS